MERTLKFDEIDITILQVAVGDHVAYLKEDLPKPDSEVTEEHITQTEELLDILYRR